MTDIKICGLFRDQDIDYVNEAGPDYAGFILNFPKSHRNLRPDQAARLRERLRLDIKAVCVLVDQPIETVLDIAARVHPDVIQLHGNEDEEYIANLKERIRRDEGRSHGREEAGDNARVSEPGCPSNAGPDERKDRKDSGGVKGQTNGAGELSGIRIWKAFRVRNEADLTVAAACGADEVLLDNGYGTGRVFDWTKAEAFDRPFILAGGLTPENIPDAIRLLRPVVLDISSGVETDRVKDREKILAAVRAAHERACCGM